MRPCHLQRHADMCHPDDLTYSRHFGSVHYQFSATRLSSVPRGPTPGVWRERTVRHPSRDILTQETRNIGRVREGGRWDGGTPAPGLTPDLTVWPCLLMTRSNSLHVLPSRTNGRLTNWRGICHNSGTLDTFLAATVLPYLYIMEVVTLEQNLTQF